MLNLISSGVSSAQAANVCPLDLSGVPSTPALAMSQARRLRSGHTGDIFRLVYNGDSSTHAFGTDSDFWLDWDAVEAAVTETNNIYTLETWYDQGLGGNHATQATSSNRPRYKYGAAGQPNTTSFQWFAGGWPAAQFDGTDFLTTANTSTSEGSLYCIAVLGLKDWYQASTYFGILGFGAAAASGLAIIAKTGGASEWSAGDALAYGAGSNISTVPKVYGGYEELTVQYGTPVIMEWLIEDGGTDRIRLNGQTVATTANAAAMPAISTQPFILGGTGIASQYLVGQLAEIMLFIGNSENVPDAAARDRIFANVNNVYKTTRFSPEAWT